MNVALGATDVERFRAFVCGRFGLQLDDAKLGLLAEVLRRRVDASSTTADAFLARLEDRPAVADLRAIVAELTVPETYFFRNIDQFHAFREIVLPERMVERAGSKQLRILSAGCASGEEPYTLAILVREAALGPSWKVSIAGMDLSEVTLEKAARGRFSGWALRETPPEARRRWFREDEGQLVLDEEIRRTVTFAEHNLVDDTREPWVAESFDVVFCRNVMMYFTPERAQTVIARITRALAPGGYLFLGHAETLRGVSNDFHLRHTHGTFYYQRKQAFEPRTAPAAAVSAAPVLREPLAALFEGAGSWVDTIHRASARIQTLASHASNDSPKATPEPPGPPRPNEPAAQTWSVARALELLERERFADALEVVHALPLESARDPQVLLLRAVLLTHSGQLPAAEDACNALLELDELDAGAHYLLALCREGSGDRRGATDHDQIAAYLDPAFAMPRLHLGLLERRADDRDSARRDLGHALVLLQREDTSRLLLFGGGFAREALIALCRTELVAVGGAP
jgi:chemotaxis protein methyltransferase CheR